MEKKQKFTVRDMVEIALFMAIIALLAFSPLGYIRTPLISGTTMHIPVILAGILFGSKKGAITGFMFGVTSFLNATFFNPNMTSFLFTPFMHIVETDNGAIQDAGGNFASLIICFVPRILIGVTAALSFRFIKKVSKNETVSLGVAAVIGSMTNTILVMGMAYIFFAERLAQAWGQEVSGIFVYILGAVIVGNGVPEAILAAILTIAIGKALLVVNKNRVNR